MSKTLSVVGWIDQEVEEEERVKLRTDASSSSEGSRFGTTDGRFVCVVASDFLRKCGLLGEMVPDISIMCDDVVEGNGNGFLVGGKRTGRVTRNWGGGDAKVEPDFDF